MTFSRWQACSLLGLILLTPVGRADAQPTISPLGFPAPNATGWNNSTVRVLFFCAPAQPCPEARWIDEEGRDQVVTGSITDGQGQGVRESVSLNIDWTAPRVQIATPADRLVTRASSIQIVANASDALSGVASATCGGVPAGIDSRGGIRCVVDLLPGINDVVVEATDHADNSGSIGIRVTRTGDTSTLRVVPQVLSVLVGRARTLQVMDELRSGAGRDLDGGQSRRRRRCRRDQCPDAEGRRRRDRHRVAPRRQRQRRGECPSATGCLSAPYAGAAEALP